MSRRDLVAVLRRQLARGVACPIVWDSHDITDPYGTPFARYPYPARSGDLFPTGVLTRDPDRRWTVRMSSDAGTTPWWPWTTAGIRLALMHDEQGERALCDPYACDPVGWWLDDE